MSGYSKENLGTITCPKCGHAPEWEDMFHGKNARMISWDANSAFDYECEQCKAKFTVVTIVHHQFIVKPEDDEDQEEI